MRKVGLLWAAVTVAVGTCGAATYTWTGNGGNARFSNPANWDGNPSAFTANDTVIFANANQLSVTVDAPVTVGTVSFTGTGTVTIGGVALTVTKITNASEIGHVFSCPVTFSGGYLVDFTTVATTFAGGATATFPDPATTDNEASHTFLGSITFTADWTQGKIAYPYVVPSGTQLYGKHVTGTSIATTANTNPNGLMLAIAEGGYAEFDSVTVGDKVARISIRGHMKVNGIFQAGTDVADGNSHVGFDGDEAYPAVLEASGILKGSHRQVYVKPATIYIGKDGFGALQPDYTFHFDGGEKTIYATDDFEVVGPLNSGNIYDWGVAIDKAVTLNTQGHTVTWTGAVTGAGAFTKTGDGTLIMKPNGCNLSTPITVSGGKVVIANQRGLGSVAVSFASGTTLELNNPDRTTVANPVTLAKNTTLMFNLVSGQLQGRLGAVTANGTVRVIITGNAGAVDVEYALTSGAQFTQDDLSKFVLDGRDDLRLDLSPAGDLIARVIRSTTSVSTFTYAAANADEAVWSTDVAAWTQAGSAVKMAFAAGGNAIFNSAIPDAAATLAVPGDITIGHVTVDTDSNLTLSGTGVLNGIGTIIKSGAGTLTLDGPSLDGQNLVITGGQVVLGADASENALGTDSAISGGTVTVINGGQFNINYIGEGTDAGGHTARAELTQHKTFVIQGDGPDGNGAIVNEALDGRETHNASWGAQLRRIELAGNAVIGGPDRFDVRTRSGTAATAKPGIYGHGKILTVKNTGYFGLVGQPIDVAGVLITGGGVFRPEDVAESNISIPNGIVLDDGTLHAYNTTYPDTVQVRVTTAGGAISSQSGTTTFKTAALVPASAELRLEGSGGNVMYDGGIRNQGTISVTGGGHNFSGGQLYGDGAWKLSGGSLYFYQTADLLSPKAITITGGTFFYGKETTGLGKLNQPVTLNADGGTLAFNLGASATILPDDVVINGTLANIYLYNTNDRAVKGRLENYVVNNLTSGFRVGAGSPADYTLGAGTQITAENFYLANADNCPYALLTLEEGSSLSVKGAFKIGDGSGTGEYRLVVDGGTVTQTGTTRLQVGRNTETANVDLKSGTMDLYGIQCREAWKPATNFTEKFTMDGGTLKIGAGGLCAWTHFDPFVVFNNGTVTCTDNWVVEQLRAVAFGDRAGGQVDFNIGDKTIDWRTGLAGAADVTLKGTGIFKSGVGVVDAIRFQGAATGKWTIENTGTNDLYGAAAFLGGLHLKEGISANLRIGGSNLVESVFFQTGSGKFAEACASSNVYPFVCNDLTFLHGKSGSANIDNCNVMWRGQFYADTAGTWTFAGGYDDSVRIDVDGQMVMECTTWSAVGKGSIDLTVGWHDFRVVQYQAGGGWGSVPSGWGNVMNVGFAKSAVDNTDAANYTRFDADHLPLRTDVTTGVGGTVNWRVVHQKSDWNTRTDWTFQSVTNKLSMLSIYNVVLPETIGNSVHMFDGWVYVPAAKAGDWQVYLDFDDWASLKIDGVDSGATGQNNEAGHKGTISGVTTGWHRFELRVCDTGGNWGPWSGTTGQVKNPLATVTVNDVTYLFDETAFRFSHLKPVEYAGLDGELCLDAGSTLSNKATAACPIWGTLTGTGTLSGPFAFAGEANVWKMAGVARSSMMGCVRFNQPDAAALAELRRIEVVFDDKPIAPAYELGSALGADPTAIALEVKDKDGVDYTAQFSLIVSDDNLYLKNARPAGTIILLQ